VFYWVNYACDSFTLDFMAFADVLALRYVISAFVTASFNVPCAPGFC